MGVLFYLRSDGQNILLCETVMAVFVVDYYTIRQWAFFSTWLVSDTIMAVFLLLFY